MKILCVGDIHIQPNNIDEVNIFFDKLYNKINTPQNKKKSIYDIVVFMGDVLHHQNRIFVNCLNTFVNWIFKISKLVCCYIIVGNHDMTDSSQYLTENHFMNFFKMWKTNIYIVDDILTLDIGKKVIYFCPYMHKSEFINSLRKYDSEMGTNFEEGFLIFCHQEFKGAITKFGPSLEGTEWNENYPTVVSGHIHTSQIVPPNIYYTGSSLQVFNNSCEKKSLLEVTIFKDSLKIKKLFLDIPDKKIIKIKQENVESISDIERNIVNSDFEEPSTFCKFEIELSEEKHKVFKNNPEFKKLKEKYNINIKETINQENINLFLNTQKNKKDFPMMIKEKINKDDKIMNEIFNKIFY